MSSTGSTMHPTHAGYALRAVDVAAGRVPGVNPHGLRGLHPDSEKPIGYDQAIDAATGLNYMDTPADAFLHGVSPTYTSRVRLIAPGTILDDVQKALGYRVGESYWMPVGWELLPPVWTPDETKNTIEIKAKDLPNTPTPSLPTPRPALQVGDKVYFYGVDGVVVESRFLVPYYGPERQQVRLAEGRPWVWADQVDLITPYVDPLL